MASDGLNAVEIAELTGFHQTTILRAAMRENIRLPVAIGRGRKKSFEDDVFIDAQKAGCTLREAADRIGCSSELVRTRAKALGICFRVDPNFTRARRRKPRRSKARKPAPTTHNLPKVKTMADYAAEEVAAMRRARMI
ncbi:hypothetical protein [Tateyamaria omphalii]|uniref:hypothetical protein n=1 Tax=Tateyamaria omphalii TaxID=299262 RepID=UPI001674D39C|nr:hypothetical protein [Tateyamaria omphalii]